MVNRLIVANLISRPVRSMLSVFAIAIEVVLIMMVVGLTHGIMEESGKRVQGVGAEIMVQPPTTSVLMGLSGAPMPVQIADRLAEIPHVQAVAPVMVQVSAAGGVTLIYGIDLERFSAVSGGFHFLEGRGIEVPDEILVDDIHARAHQLQVGQTVELLNQPFRLAGIVEHGQGARIFMRLDTLQDLMGSAGKASVFFVKLTDPQYIKAALDQMHTLLPNYQVRDMKEYLSLMTTSNLPGLDDFINVMIALAVSIGLFVIFITMYSAIVERTREIGILKSMGASKGYIVRLVLRETAVLTVLGIASGIGLSFAVRRLVGVVFPTLPILITPEWILLASVIALTASFVGAGYPAFRATKLDAIEALSYE